MLFWRLSFDPKWRFCPSKSQSHQARDARATTRIGPFHFSSILIIMLVTAHSKPCNHVGPPNLSLDFSLSIIVVSNYTYSLSVYMRKTEFVCVLCNLFIPSKGRFLPFIPFDFQSWSFKENSFFKILTIHSFTFTTLSFSQVHISLKSLLFFTLFMFFIRLKLLPFCKVKFFSTLLL